MNKQDRLVVRMAARPEVAAFVKLFRTQHADWPALVHFLLYKNTSGKWKTTEQKRRRKKKNKGDLPFPIPASLPLASDEDEVLPHLQTVKAREGFQDNRSDSDWLSAYDLGINYPVLTSGWFAAFKEAHDRRLLEEQKKLIADEEAELALAPPLRPQAAIPPPHHPFFPEEEEEKAADEMDADSDTASEIVANLIAHRSTVHQPGAPERKMKDNEEETRGKKNKRKSEQFKKPPPSTPSDDGALLPVQKPQKKAKIQKESVTKSDVTIPGNEVRKTAVMEETESTKAAKINKPAPADAFFSEIIDGTEPESTPLSVDEDEALFGADDLELKTEVRFPFRPSYFPSGCYFGPYSPRYYFSVG
ncbi:unnamed protein product [Dibothriocephalus latus]|uniref:Uncharacterized protein n=1 Tax=Dibothriocephalus latus TaxID=60516 RepID=A0A3P7P5M4_DIBLA|nr:unnamed protein product [Dibothriocephalus latus]